MNKYRVTMLKNHAGHVAFTPPLWVIEAFNGSGWREVTVMDAHAPAMTYADRLARGRDV